MYRHPTSLIVFAWLVLTGISPSFAAQTYTDAWLDGTPRLRERAVLLAETLGQRGTTMLAPAPVEVHSPPNYEVGDTHAFYALHMGDGSQYSLIASCHAVSDKAYLFVEEGTPAASDKISSLLAAFDDIYEAITDSFGPPPDSIDEDPRVYILVLDIMDGAQVDGTMTLGYFDALNQYRDNELPRWLDEHSNEVEMLYIDHVALAEHGGEGVVAHEFTHLVQWARDPEETIWVDEGIAVYAEAMLGYEVTGRISAFEDAPHTPLMTWSGSIADYGAAYLFFEYISERFGGTSTVSAIVTGDAEGVEGIEQGLEAQGEEISFADLFSEWVLANYFDTPDLHDGIYGYTSVDVNLEPSVIEESYPLADREFLIEPWSVHYVEFHRGEDEALNITIASDSRWNDIDAHVLILDNEAGLLPVEPSDETPMSFHISQGSQTAILAVTSQPNPPEARMRFSDYTYSADTNLVEEPAAVSTLGKRVTTWGAIKRD